MHTFEYAFLTVLALCSYSWEIIPAEKFESQSHSERRVLFLLIFVFCKAAVSLIEPLFKKHEFKFTLQLFQRNLQNLEL